MNLMSYDRNKITVLPFHKEFDFPQSFQQSSTAMRLAFYGAVTNREAVKDRHLMINLTSLKRKVDPTRLRTNIVGRFEEPALALL